MRRLYNAILHAIWAFKNPQTLEQANFKMLSDLLVLILKVQNEDRHMMSNIAFVHPTEGVKQIASIWVGAGIGSCPTKRIGELLFEIEKLKKELAKSNFDSDKYTCQLFENFQKSTLEDIHKVVECRAKILELKVSSGLREEIVDFMLKPMDTLLHA